MRHKTFKIQSILLCVILVISLLIPGAQPTHAATVHTVGTYNDLLSALSTAVDGDTIAFSADIGILDTLIIDKNIAVNGNGHTIAVPVPGLDEMGLLNASPSEFSVFSIASAATVSIENLRILGGNAQGAGIYNSGMLTLRGVSITNCANTSDGGAGIYNNGTAVLASCNISRNASAYGGGFYNGGGRVMFIDNSSFCENRSLSSNGGGGAGENGGTVYINNSTFSNNKSTELGGAINNYRGSLTVLNSTFTGNVAYSVTYHGGAIANNGGSVTVANCLFAYNYCLDSSSQYILDDISIFSGSPATAINCMFHADSSASVVGDPSNRDYAGAADGSDNSLFSGGYLTKVLDATGAPVSGSNLVFQPFVISTAAGVSVCYLKSVNDLTGSGIQTAFYADPLAPVLGYFDGTSWVDLVGADSGSHIVTQDQSGMTRSIPGTIGSMEATTSDIFMVKIIAPENGFIQGATIYGDIYPANTSITLTATPDNGYHFSEWTAEDGSVVSDSSLYTFALTENVTLTATFLPNAANEFVITYKANHANHTGIPPATQTYTDSSTIEGNGTLAVSDAQFTHWNTAPDGSGTSYDPGDIYTGPDNIVLYAQWSAKTQVRFQTNGGSSIASLYLDPTDILPQPTSPTKDGYNFAGWYSDTALTLPVTFGNPVGANDITLYAKWIGVEVTVSFDTDGGNSISPVVRRFDFAYGLDSAGNSSPLPIPAKTGFVFLGWYRIDGADTVSITNTTILSIKTSHTLKARWSPQVEVAFDLQGGQGSIAPQIKVVNTKYGLGSDGVSAMPLPVPTRTHYDFTGWYTAATAGTLVTNDTVVTNASKHTLYAGWTTRMCTVTFSSMGGTSVPAQTVASGNPIAKPTAPTWAGHTFQGWYSASTGGSAYNFSTAVTASFTLYARWTSNSGPVTPGGTDPAVTRISNQIDSLTANSDQPMTFESALQILQTGNDFDRLNDTQTAQITSTRQKDLAALQNEAVQFLTDHLDDVAPIIPPFFPVEDYIEYYQLMQLNEALGPTVAELLSQEDKEVIARIQTILADNVVLEKADTPAGYFILNEESIAQSVLAADPTIGRLYYRTVIKPHPVDEDEISSAVAVMIKQRQQPVEVFTAYIVCTIYKTDGSVVENVVNLSDIGGNALLQIPFGLPETEEASPEYSINGVSAAMLMTTYPHEETVIDGKTFWNFETDQLGETNPVFAITQKIPRDLTWLYYAGGGVALLGILLLLLGIIRKKRAEKE